MPVTVNVMRSMLSAAMLLALASTQSLAQGSSAVRPLDTLQQLNGTVESLVSRVSRSVVQVLVSTYEPIAGRDANDVVVGRQRASGSGVIIDSDGYILTNAHVVNNARRVQIMLPREPIDDRAAQPGTRGARRVDAQIVGLARDLDLALLKVDGPLPALPFADDDTVRQGALVFAFGSPQGLRDTVTMGIISAVARQSDPDNPLVYVQTDAPINPGNSGGPLVNVKGELVGINTFILSASGGSQGLGFAIPSVLVQIAYSKLRSFGHLHRGEIGMQFQAVTPLLAAGLGLSQEWGPVVSDVLPGSPAEKAGLQAKDIIVSVDGKRVDDVPRLALSLLALRDGERVTLGVRRGSQVRSIAITAAEPDHNFNRLMDVIDPEKNVVPALGVLAIDITQQTAPMLPPLREPSGVVVVARTTVGPDNGNVGLTTGDTIHSLNGVPIASIDELRRELAALKPKSPVVLQIERDGRFMYLAFELD
ncbi:MAG TPA: trypsin-like peptidase domain-containing protein [Vicinamibacterales bacterium]|nr:trypsin-like peptidase domain-containing protein [Vicinamibacterales bacterium]